MKTYELINFETDEIVGTFATRDEARQAGRKLPYYDIWLVQSGLASVRIESCEPHPDDKIQPEDTPALDPPWWETER